jgi:adenine-specific DNA-methyltransferase
MRLMRGTLNRQSAGAVFLFEGAAMSFNEKLTELLKTDPRLVDENGELVIAAVQDHAWKIDHALVRLLLRDEEIKAKFFEEIDGYWIFNTNLFIDFISQKNFLDNSYTRFRNRIGLTIGGKFLRERGEVALAWPYKDSVLEGGQTQEEEKRRELFFNEVLAQDEISRLFDPKVLTHFTRYSMEGQAQVSALRRDADGQLRENLIIRGNNLLALHSLKSQFRGAVKLIYIDPPYNTGNDSFGYNDNFNHSTWLTFMKNRLEIARELLTNDGSIWISVDDAEAHYLKVEGDEIFGKENFIMDIAWKKRDGAPNDRKVGGVHEHILVFGKDKAKSSKQTLAEESFNLLPRTEKADEQYKVFPEPNGPDPRGPFRKIDTTANAKGGRFVASLVYPIQNPYTKENVIPRRGTCWRHSKEEMDRLQNEGRLYWGVEGTAKTPMRKLYLSETRQGMTIPSLWVDVALNQHAASEIEQLFGQKAAFETPKPEHLLQRIIHVATNPGEMVLDFFAGSGTTAAVAHKMGRQYIGIEQMDYIESITLKRLEKVIGKMGNADGKLFEELAYDEGGISKAVNWRGGGEFVYCELLQFNQVFMERIQAAQSSAELMTVWRAMAEHSFLKWYVNPSVPQDALKDFEDLGQGPDGLSKQKRLLAELLDKNQLYVNLSEIDDQQFQVSAEDKALNRAFYGEADHA